MQISKERTKAARRRRGLVKYPFEQVGATRQLAAFWTLLPK